jgi:hypothetical protein
VRLAIPVAAMLLIGLAPSAAARAPDVSELVGPTAQIPRDHYQTWSLFLVCNPAWVEPDKSAELSGLYRRFKAFGEAIGHDNLAVWFWKNRLPVSDPRLAENVDVARSAEFCQLLHLMPSDGPHLVITNAYPDVAAFPKERAIYALGGLPATDLAKLLGKLTDQLLLQNRVDVSGPTPAPGSGAASPTPPAAPAPSLWIRLLESARQSIIGFGCAVKLQIDTGLLSAEVRACAGP